MARPRRLQLHAAAFGYEQATRRRRAGSAALGAAAGALPADVCPRFQPAHFLLALALGSFSRGSPG